MCGRSYVHKPSLWRHRKFECGKAPSFACPHCEYKAKLREHLKSHIATVHAGKSCNLDDKNIETWN